VLYEGVGREMSELDHDGEEDEGQSCVGFVTRKEARNLQAKAVGWYG